jgi:hypothetical protein
MALALGTQKRNVDLVKIGFTGKMYFIDVRYLVTNRVSRLSQSGETEKYGHGPHGARNQEVQQLFTRK